MSVLEHKLRRNLQYNRLSPSGADTPRRLLVRRQVYVHSASSTQPVQADRTEKPLHRPMKQQRERLNRRQAYTNFYGMSLIRLNPVSVGADRETLLVVLGHNFTNKLSGQSLPAFIREPDQLIQVSPPTLVQNQAYLLRFMPQDQAQELTD